MQDVNIKNCAVHTNIGVVPPRIAEDSKTRYRMMILDIPSPPNASSSQVSPVVVPDYKDLCVVGDLNELGDSDDFNDFGELNDFKKNETI